MLWCRYRMAFAWLCSDNVAPHRKNTIMNRGPKNCMPARNSCNWSSLVSSLSLSLCMCECQEICIPTIDTRTTFGGSAVAWATLPLSIRPPKILRGCICQVNRAEWMSEATKAGQSIRARGNQYGHHIRRMPNCWLDIAATPVTEVPVTRDKLCVFGRFLLNRRHSLPEMYLGSYFFVVVIFSEHRTHTQTQSYREKINDFGIYPLHCSWFIHSFFFFRLEARWELLCDRKLCPNHRFRRFHWLMNNTHTRKTSVDFEEASSALNDET